jgi:hypothetical protein
MSELSTGVKTLVSRMETHPEEFFGEANKWRFMFGERFREVMTEPEKAALHAALKEVRRKEFDALAVRTLLQDEINQAAMVGHQAVISSQNYTGQNLALSTGNFGTAKMLTEGGKVSY